MIIGILVSLLVVLMIVLLPLTWFCNRKRIQRRRPKSTKRSKIPSTKYKGSRKTENLTKPKKALTRRPRLDEEAAIGEPPDVEDGDIASDAED